MDSDSEFYGDEETTSALETRVANFDIVSWWDRHQPLPTSIHQPGPSTPLHNPYEHLPSARQLTESIPTFLARLPPATTDWRPGHDWIWIANPHDPRPPSSPQSLTHLRLGGASRLALLTAFQQAAHPPTTTAAKLSRSLSLARRSAIADLTALAGASGIVAGKWMLFPAPGDVNEVWAKVAHATAEGGLGISAKVETRVEADKARLVCVYTRDFRDKGDVARVLRRLGELELVRPSGPGLGGRQIYYKCDAWTELGIYGGNEWGIGASMYSSNEIFGYLKTMASGGS